MKLLHTSDWHLGRTLYSKKERHDEHAAFLEWLIGTIEEQKIDLLIVAGDVFNTPSPSSASQKMYYEFLVKATKIGCNNIIIIGGNHDSPNFLNAPKEVLSTLNITVVGNATEDINDEIIEIKDSDGKTKFLVCAVPFLRERDISKFLEQENYADRTERINESIKNHYEKIAQVAEDKRNELGENMPTIATGHLSVLGGKRDTDDGVRETYIGNIQAINSDIFPKTFDYVALGHYHIPSVIKHHIRYSGSPIPMGFAETNQQKCVYVVDFHNEIDIQTIEIPVFQKMESIRGDKKHIENRIAELKETNSSVWVEIVYDGDEVFHNLSDWANELVENSEIEILKLQNIQNLNKVLTQTDTTELLDNLDVFEVFDTMLEKNNISDAQREELRASYKEIVDTIQINNPL